MGAKVSLNMAGISHTQKDYFLLGAKNMEIRPELVGDCKKKFSFCLVYIVLLSPGMKDDILHVITMD
jgi:hypothetical protein